MRACTLRIVDQVWSPVEHHVSTYIIWWVFETLKCLPTLMKKTVSQLNQCGASQEHFQKCVLLSIYQYSIINSVKLSRTRTEKLLRSVLSLRSYKMFIKVVSILWPFQIDICHGCYYHLKSYLIVYILRTCWNRPEINHFFRRIKNWIP